ncbi:MAG: FCD domain-containing protein [Bryobacteraceae bacterium]|nr:FCD domain-containing protein [Bryobacteraceae bacterium]
MVWLRRVDDSKQPERTGGRAEGAEAPRGEDGSSRSVLDRLRTYLLEQGWETGSRLPAERAMAEAVGVGRPALREGLKTLAALGIVESHRGAGSLLRSREALESLGRISQRPVPARYGTLDVLEVRRMMEPKAAWFATTRAGERELREVEEARVAFEEAVGGEAAPERVARLDLELHAAILRASKNPLLVWMGDVLEPVLLRSRRDWARTGFDHAKTCEEHSAIVQAILRRDPQAAESAMSEHLMEMSASLVKEARR